MLNKMNNYSIAISKCGNNCNGKRSLWRAALGERYACPLGVAFCSAWDPDKIVVKPVYANPVVAGNENVA